jgi:glycosyltransferase involved in cell wall biosynthesis
MMRELKFSVIIPVYNREKQIADAIRSVLEQRYQNFELIVVDDGSTDRTAEVVKTFADPRVKYIHQENRERAAARNNGIKNSTGDFITFLDSDDEFLPEHLEFTREFIEANPSGEVFCTSFKIVSAQKTTENIMPDDIREKLSGENFLSCNGVFLPADIAKRFLFNEERSMSGLEDWELWLRIGAVHKMTGSKTITTQMNNHDERSVLQTERADIERRFETFYRHVLANPAVTTFYKNSLRKLKASCETYIALHLALAKKNRGAAFMHLFRGICYSPAIIFKRRFYAILKRII